jgi:hypothetical protein
MFRTYEYVQAVHFGILKWYIMGRSHVTDIIPLIFYNFHLNCFTVYIILKYGAFENFIRLTSDNSLIKLRLKLIFTHKLQEGLYYIPASTL